MSTEFEYGSRGDTAAVYRPAYPFLVGRDHDQGWHKDSRFSGDFIVIRHRHQAGCGPPSGSTADEEGKAGVGLPKTAILGPQGLSGIRWWVRRCRSHGIEYASMFAVRGAGAPRSPFRRKNGRTLLVLATEIVEALKFHLARPRGHFPGSARKVTAGGNVGAAGTVHHHGKGAERQITPRDTGGCTSAGRPKGQKTEHLDMYKAGLKPDGRGRISSKDGYGPRLNNHLTPSATPSFGFPGAGREPR